MLASSLLIESTAIRETSYRDGTRGLSYRLPAPQRASASRSPSAELQGAAVAAKTSVRLALFPELAWTKKGWNVIPCVANPS